MHIGSGMSLLLSVSKFLKQAVDRVGRDREIWLDARLVAVLLCGLLVRRHKRRHIVPKCCQQEAHQLQLMAQAKRRATKIGSKSVVDSIFGHFLNFDKWRPEVASDVISGVAVDCVGISVPDGRTTTNDHDDAYWRTLSRDGANAVKPHCRQCSSNDPLAITLDYHSYYTAWRWDILRYYYYYYYYYNIISIDRSKRYPCLIAWSLLSLNAIKHQKSYWCGRFVYADEHRRRLQLFALASNK